jgi:hypothetical protein
MAANFQEPMQQKAAKALPPFAACFCAGFFLTIWLGDGVYPPHYIFTSALHSLFVAA